MISHHGVDAQMLKAEFAISDDMAAACRSVGRMDILTNAQEKQAQWEVVCDHALANDLLGFVLRNSNSTQWCVITPDVEAGKFRYSAFDVRGFYMHGVYNTPEQALIEVFRMGFRYPDSPDTLDRLCQAPQWVAYHNA